MGAAETHKTDGNGKRGLIVFRLDRIRRKKLEIIIQTAVLFMV